jgi:hypothetical protein
MSDYIDGELGRVRSTGTTVAAVIERRAFRERRPP